MTEGHENDPVTEGHGNDPVTEGHENDPVTEGESTGRPLVAVLDYGSGNVHSAVKALAAAGADARLTADRGLIDEAAGLVVPGVGAAATRPASTPRVRAGGVMH